jgi:hypothetical protein
MGDIVELKPAPLEDDELIENLARFADGTLSEAKHDTTSVTKPGQHWARVTGWLS